MTNDDGSTSSHRGHSEKKKKQQPSSCLQCKRNHKKCNKQEPKCSYCIGRNLDCVYEEPKKRGRASELYQENLKKKKEGGDVGGGIPGVDQLINDYFDFICVGHPVIRRHVLEYFITHYLSKFESCKKLTISPPLLLEDEQVITSMEDLRCVYAFYLSVKGIYHQLRCELELADQFAKNSEVEIGKLFVDHSNNYYLYCACQQLSSFYSGRGDLLKRKIYLSMVEHFVKESLKETDLISKNLERRSVFLSKSMDELFNALPDFIEHFPRIVELSVDQKLEQLLLPGTLEYMKTVSINSENYLLFKQVIDFVFKVVISLKSELFKQLEDCRTERFTEFMQLHIIFTYNSTSLSFFRNVPELRSLVEEMALKISYSTEHELFRYIYSDAGIAVLLVSEIHLEICKMIESGLRHNNLPMFSSTSNNTTNTNTNNNNGKSMCVDYFSILEKDLNALKTLSQKYMRIKCKCSNMIVEMETVLERHYNPPNLLHTTGSSSYPSESSLVNDGENGALLMEDSNNSTLCIPSSSDTTQQQHDEKLQSILKYLQAISDSVQENIPNYNNLATLGDLEREFFEF